MGIAVYQEYFRHCKKQSLLEKIQKIYPNKYSSSDFWNIRITEARVDSEEKYEEEARWIWNEFNFP